MKTGHPTVGDEDTGIYGKYNLKGTTYIWMISNLLDDRVIEVTRVSQEVCTNLVGVSETFKDIACDGELGALSQLGSLSFTLSMDILYPAVMIGCSLFSYVLLEDDDVRVGNLDSVRSREDWSGLAVDSLGIEGWSR